MEASTPPVLEPRDALEDAPDLGRFSTLQRMAGDPRTRFVVSLGGGSVPALCGNAALVGLIEELGLREHVAEVWGTSSGAIVGGAWASGTGGREILARLLSLQRKRMLDVSWLKVALGFVLHPFGVRTPDALLRGRHFHDTLLAGLSVRTFEECVIPFRCIACTDPGLSRKVFREGPLAPAISASMSLPGLLLPRDEHGRRCHGYFDGGLVEKTPLFSPLADHARLGDGSGLLILGTHFGTEERHIAQARGFVDRFLVTIDSLEERLWEYQHQAVDGKPGVTVLMIDPHLEDHGSFDFKRIERDYLRARAAFMDKLENARIALTLGAS